MMTETQINPFTRRNYEASGVLAEVFAPCFSLILKLRETDEYGDSDLLRSRIIDLLKTAHENAMHQAIPSEDIKDARFAIVAFLDETVISSSWSERVSWITRPLQVQFYGEAVAGKEFYDRLERLKADAAMRHDVLNVYYLCLALGFKGKYQMMGAAGQNELRTQIEDTYARLRATAHVSSQALSPNGLPGDQFATEVKSKLPSWVIAVSAACVGLIVYLVFSFMLNGSLNEACAQLAAFTTGTCD